MSEEVVVRYHFVGSGYIDCEYIDKEMYLLSITRFEAGLLLFCDNKVINPKNVTYFVIIKERVMNID